MQVVKRIGTCLATIGLKIQKLKILIGNYLVCEPEQVMQYLMYL